MPHLREHTKYYKCTMLAACRKIFNCIRDYSDCSQKRNVFNKIPRFDKDIKEKANKIKENQFNKSHTRSTRIEYTGYNDTNYIITLNDPLINKNWYGMKNNLLDKFARNKKKGAKPKSGRTGKINGALEHDSD